MRRGFWIAFWGVLTAAVWRGALLAADVRNLRLNEVSGHGPAYAKFSWGYGAGARPQSIIFDLRMGTGVSGSITTDGEATEAEVPVGGVASGRYQICATATYRILGVVRNTEYRFTGILHE